MSKMSDALIVCGEINNMLEFHQDDLNTDSDELNAFMVWAIEQHRAAARKDLGIDDVTLNALLQQQISFQVDCKIADDNYENDYRSIALALYRYYLIVYKDAKRDELTYEDLEIINGINEMRVA
jgi:hypothetical protein